MVRWLIVFAPWLLARGLHCDNAQTNWARKSSAGILQHVHSYSANAIWVYLMDRGETFKLTWNNERKQSSINVNPYWNKSLPKSCNHKQSTIAFSISFFHIVTRAFLLGQGNRLQVCLYLCLQKAKITGSFELLTSLVQKKRGESKQAACLGLPRPFSA